MWHDRAITLQSFFSLLLRSKVSDDDNYGSTMVAVVLITSQVRRAVYPLSPSYTGAPSGCLFSMCCFTLKSVSSWQYAGPLFVQLLVPLVVISNSLRDIRNGLWESCMAKVRGKAAVPLARHVQDTVDSERSTCTSHREEGGGSGVSVSGRYVNGAFCIASWACAGCVEWGGGDQPSHAIPSCMRHWLVSKLVVGRGGGGAYCG